MRDTGEAEVLGDVEDVENAEGAEDAEDAQSAALRHPIEAKVDSGALERIFANLLQNAGRYAKSRLWVTLEESDTQVLIAFANDVEDIEEVGVKGAEAKGIEAEKLFVPFHTQNKSRTTGSTGLGLAIVRRLAEYMNARLEVCVEIQGVDQLIRFTLILPRETL
ncbi:MAG: ATP-binding protein [Coriobacteriales bacterium]|nr:ATP-binding protein [Coriobacteriales bacterium]